MEIDCTIEQTPKGLVVRLKPATPIRELGNSAKGGSYSSAVLLGALPSEGRLEFGVAGSFTLTLSFKTGK